MDVPATRHPKSAANRASCWWQRQARGLVSAVPRHSHAFELWATMSSDDRPVTGVMARRVARRLGLVVLPAVLLACDVRNDRGRSGAEDSALGSEGTSTLAAAEGLTEIARVGDTNAFGTIDGVKEVEESRVAVLDAANGVVSLYTRDGRLLFRFGRRGGGPGEFFAAVDLEEDTAGRLLVLDRGSQRISVLQIVGDSLALARELHLRFTPGDMCLVEGRVFVLGVLEGKLIHELDADGDVVRSFGSRSDTNAFKDALTGMGRIACSNAREAIALVPRTLKEVYVYSVQGALLRKDSIPGYSEIVYATNGTSVRPRTPASGYWNEIAAVTWIDDNTVLVQLHREPNPGSPLLQGREFRLDGGWAPTPRALPRVGDIVGKTVYVMEANPYPLVKAYRVP